MNTYTTEGRLLYRVEEAANLVGLSRAKFYEIVSAGEIRPIKIGRSVRISRVALEEWVARQEGRGGAA
jgi:excisionase family DNA binding protein